MAAHELVRNYATRYCVFYIDSSSDIENLPTALTGGKGDLILSAPCSIGSLARDKDGKQYTLSGENEWVATSSSSGGGGGGGISDADIASVEEVTNMLNEVLDIGA